MPSNLCVQNISYIWCSINKYIWVHGMLRVLCHKFPKPPPLAAEAQGSSLNSPLSLLSRRRPTPFFICHITPFISQPSRRKHPSQSQSSQSASKKGKFWITYFRCIGYVKQLMFKEYLLYLMLYQKYISVHGLLRVLLLFLLAAGCHFLELFWGPTL